MDDTYQTYVNRVAQLTLLKTYKSQIQNLQASPKYNQGKATFFPGYSVITPPCCEDRLNEEFYRQLAASQQQLEEQLEPGLLLRVPEPSFHITLADLIWHQDYQNAVEENPNFEEQLRDRIGQSLEQYQRKFHNVPLLRWQVLGLMIRPRSIGVCLIPKDEASYRYILELRRSIYQNLGLIALGIEQQYHFTAHITLGYFGEIPQNLDCDRLANTLETFDEQWMEKDPQIQQIYQVELRKFDDMTHYYREPHWPILKF